MDEVGRAGQRNQTHYHRHYYDGDQLHMRWETATPEKRIRPMVDALPADPSLIARAAGAEEFRGDDLDAREKRLEARKSGRRSPVDVRNSVRDKLKNSVAFSGNAQTAAVRLRHAFKRHARRGVSRAAARCYFWERGAWSGRARAPSPRRRTWGRCCGSSASNWTSELEALLGEVQGNAVPVEAVVRDVARCVAGVCWVLLFRAANELLGLSPSGRRFAPPSTRSRDPLKRSLNRRITIGRARRTALRGPFRLLERRHGAEMP